MSKRYKKIFLIRFLGFFFIQVGIVTLILVLEPVISEEFKYRAKDLLNIRQYVPQVVTSNNPDGSSEPQPTPKPAGFGSLLFQGSSVITPVDTNFGIVIEKIGANAKVIANVDPGNEKAYTKALSEGVAHAKGTVFPGQNGNIYLFSHSVDAPWNVVRFNAVFYLLSKLEKGDRIVMFYQGRRFDYTVFDKAIVAPADTHFLTGTYTTSVLTLQTCDPPGTLVNRLVVRAKLGN